MSYLTGLDIFRGLDADLENDIIYSDDDDEDDDRFYTPSAAHRPLEPHPRIRQLTDEVCHLFVLFEKDAKEVISVL